MAEHVQMGESRDLEHVLGPPALAWRSLALADLLLCDCVPVEQQARKTPMRNAHVFLLLVGSLLLGALVPCDVDAQFILVPRRMQIDSYTNLHVTQGQGTTDCFVNSNESAKILTLQPQIGAVDSNRYERMCGEIRLSIFYGATVTELESGPNQRYPVSADVRIKIDVVYPDGTRVVVGDQTEQWHVPSPGANGSQETPVHNVPGVVFDYNVSHRVFGAG
jgi:hypothetical protein